MQRWVGASNTRCYRNALFWGFFMQNFSRIWRHMDFLPKTLKRFEQSTPPPLPSLFFSFRVIISWIEPISHKGIAVETRHTCIRSMVSLSHPVYTVTMLTLFYISILSPFRSLELSLIDPRTSSPFSFDLIHEYFS